MANNALTWTRRSGHRWQEAVVSRPAFPAASSATTQRTRADALGHVYPDINEAKIVATYHRTTRYHHGRGADAAAEYCIAAGATTPPPDASSLRWASQDLRAYGQHCWQPKTQQFISLLTDGRPIPWEKARPGYYDASSFAPAEPPTVHLPGLRPGLPPHREPGHWDMTRQLAETMGVGDIGKTGSGERSPAPESSAQDGAPIYVLVELARATDDRTFLKLARIGDNLLATQTVKYGDPVPGRGVRPNRGRRSSRAAAPRRHPSPLMLDNAFLLPSSTAPWARRTLTLTIPGHTTARSFTERSDHAHGTHIKRPPFYTHVIGSLPHPQAVRDLLARRAQMPPERFMAALDDMVRVPLLRPGQAGIAYWMFDVGCWMLDVRLLQFRTSKRSDALTGPALPTRSCRLPGPRAERTVISAFAQWSPIATWLQYRCFYAAGPVRVFAVAATAQIHGRLTP